MITKQVTPIGIETKIVTMTFVLVVVKEFNIMLVILPKISSLCPLKYSPVLGCCGSSGAAAIGLGMCLVFCFFVFIVNAHCSSVPILKSSGAGG